MDSSDDEDEDEPKEPFSSTSTHVLEPHDLPSREDQRQPPETSEYDTDVEIDDPNKSFRGVTYQERYLQACEMVGVVPASYFLRNLEAERVEMNHHGLGPKGARAIAIALVSNMNIISLSLKDNWIQDEGLADLVEMLRENYYIQELDLSNNQLQFRGSEEFCKMLHENAALQVVKLSGNAFKDVSAKHFSEALSVNFKLQQLDLSHNAFCESGGVYMGQMLANNEGLHLLDLSWNHIRMKGAVAIAAGLKVNIMLRVLNLAFNGFGNEGALALGEALKHNSTLLHLDISNNRINNEGAGRLCRGLEVNDTLRILKLSRNPLTVEGAMMLLTAVKKNTESKLEELDIANVRVNERFLDMLEETRQIHPALEVSYAGVGGFISKKPKRRPDPMKMIQNYLDERKLRLWDFFKNMDKDGTMRIPVSEFRRAMQQQSNISLDRSQIDELVERLDKDGSGVVDYRGLVDTRKQMMRNQRRRLRREESRQKKEKHKSERVLKTFKKAVETVTPHNSVVLSQDPKVLDSQPLEPRSPHRFSATPLNSWYQAETSNTGNRSAPLISGKGSRYPSTRSEPRMATNIMLSSSLEKNSTSEPKLSSKVQAQSQFTTATSGSKTYSSTTEPRESSDSQRPTRPVLRGVSKSHQSKGHYSTSIPQRKMRSTKLVKRTVNTGKTDSTA
ncbi:leucine-rich repeat-containing protein 74A isoform X1 [Lissotriton helveticus]